MQLALLMFLAWFGVGGGGNHLLDYASTDLYWQSKQVAVSDQTMSAELTRPPTTQPDTSKAAEIRELMAIRALGELKAAAALPLLTPLVDSKDLFVADYARRSIGEIQGSPVASPATAPSAADVQLLPAATGAIAQATFGPAKISTAQFFDLVKALDKNGPDAGANPPATQGGGNSAALSNEIIAIAEKIGDIRADCMTIAVANNVGEQSGWVTVIVRGQYDSQAVIASIPADAKTRMVGDTKVYEVDDNSAVMLPSDNLIIAMIGPNQDALPVAAIGTALKAGQGDLATNADMSKLLASIDTTKPVWAAALISDAFRQLPEIAGFDSVSIVGTRTDAGVDLQATATGSDGAKVQDSLKTFKGDMDDLTSSMKGADTPKQMQGFAAFLAGLQPVLTDKTANLTAHWTDDSSAVFLIEAMEALPMTDTPIGVPADVPQPGGAPAPIPPPPPPGNGM